MTGLLAPGQVLTELTSGLECRVTQFLGGGSQGEVYRADMRDRQVALKWYFPDYLRVDAGLRARLDRAVREGPPTDRFLWPQGLIVAPHLDGFGYVMELRAPRFKSLVDLMRNRIDPTFRVLATAGFELAHNFLQLHSKGFCYRDISLGNVFFDPDTGTVRICDNDNVDIDGQPGSILGTLRFMAPEIVRGQAMPSTDTDLFSLAVLLFYMLMIAHPLEGKRESQIRCLDLPAMKKLYGDEAVFIWDPEDDSNRPERGIHDHAVRYWQDVYPQPVKALFVRAFTKGIRDPRNGRLRESEWRAEMIRLRDSILYCGSCGMENFYDTEQDEASQGHRPTCWKCRKTIQLPVRIRIGKDLIMLNHDSKLYPHHVDDSRKFDFSQPLAEVIQNPSHPSQWGLKNLASVKWVATTVDGRTFDVSPGRAVALLSGTRVHFGHSEGEMQA